MRRLGASGLQFLLAMLLSLSLWTFVSFTNNPTTTAVFTLPITITNVPEGLMLVNGSQNANQAPPTVQITVSGPRNDIIALEEEDFQAIADLSDLDPNANEAPIRITKPPFVSILSQRPETLPVELAPRVTRTFDVEPEIRSNPPFLYQAREPSIDVERANVSGPDVQMARIVRVVAPIELAGRTTNYAADVQLQAVDQDGNQVTGVEIEPATASVNVRIVARVDVQRVAVAPSLRGQQAPGYTIDDFDWNPKYVEVISPIEITGTLETEPITLTNRTEPFTQTVRVLNPDPDTTRILNDTITVTVPIQPFPLPASVNWFVAVAPVNTQPGLQATVEPAGVTITISGSADQLSQLLSTSPQATVDLTGLGAGTYTLPVAVELPPGLQNIGSVPQVQVTLRATEGG